ncbi:MAG: AI-2E family transporter [Parafilimonas sp.]
MKVTHETTTQQENCNQNNSSYTKKVWIATGIVLLVCISFLLFKALFSVILLMLAGIIMASYFHGCAHLLHRFLHIPSKLSLILSVLLNIILLAGFFWFLSARLQQQISQLSDTLPSGIRQVKEQINSNPVGKKIADYLNSSGNSKKTLDIIKRFFSSGFGILSDVYIIILMGAFFTASPSVYKKGIIHLLPSKAKNTGEELIEDISGILRKWLKGQIFGFFFIAVLTGIGLIILGMPLVFTLALIAGLLNFIPNFGPVIALIPGVLIGLTQGVSTAVYVACLYTLIQIIQSAVTQPLIQKKMISVPPALLIIAQVAMGALAGFWGVLLAAPILAIIMKLINKLYVEKQSRN